MEKTKQSSHSFLSAFTRTEKYLLIMLGLIAGATLVLLIIRH